MTSKSAFIDRDLLRGTLYGLIGIGALLWFASYLSSIQ